MFKVRFYKRNGDLDHETEFVSLAEAKLKRTEWGLKIGLRPGPSLDFARYPTIWKWFDNEWIRMEGY